MTRRRRDPEFIDLATYQGNSVTVSALATYLECDTRTVIRMITNKSLKAFKVGREWRIPTDAARETFHVQPHQQAS